MNPPRQWNVTSVPMAVLVLEIPPWATSGSLGHEVGWSMVGTGVEYRQAVPMHTVPH